MSEYLVRSGTGTHIVSKQPMAPGLGQFPDFGKMYKKASKTVKKTIKGAGKTVKTVKKAGAAPLSMIGLSETPTPYSPVPTQQGVIDPSQFIGDGEEEKSKLPLYLAAGGGILTVGLVAMVLLKKKRR